MTDQHDDAPERGSQDTGSRAGTASAGDSNSTHQAEGHAEGDQPKKRSRSRGSRGRGRGRSRNKQPGEGGEGAEAQAGQQDSAPAQPSRQQPAQQPRQAAQASGNRPQGKAAQQRASGSGGNQSRPERGNSAPRKPARPAINPNAMPGNVLDPLHEMTEEELDAADRAALAKANALADAGIMPSPVAVLGGAQRQRPQRDSRQPRTEGRGQRQEGQRQENQRQDNQRQEGQRKDGQRSAGKRSEGQRGDGQRADGQRGESQRQDSRPARPARQAKPEQRQPEARGAEQATPPRADTAPMTIPIGAPEDTKPTRKPDVKPEPKAPAQSDAKAEARAESRVESRADAEIMESPGKKGRQKMFIGVLPGELVEVVLSEEGAVQEYYVEMLHQAKTKGNIYKGYIHNIDSALQAAFINYGAERNGFLQIDEVHPEYYLGSYPLKKGARFPLMQKVLRPGQEVLVQVVKEPTGKKGAFVSSYLSLPGRYFVYTLGRDQQGVSRKIEDEKERERLKSVIDVINPQEGVGLIVRTAGIGRAKTELMRDYKYLHRVWTDIKKKAQTEKAPALVYKELDLAVRAARDYLTQDVSEVWVDDPETFEQIKDYVSMAFPKSPNMVKLHADHDKTLWERFGLTRQVEQIYSREVTLPSGGRLVFDHTEALTSVDINSGKIGGEQSFAKMAHKTNMEAAAEIARQLKLRDIGGQIVIDFIEMKDGKHLRDVEKTMRQALKYDRARTDVSSISPFGLMELVRQRLGSSAISVSTEPCPCCGGTGIRRNLEWQALQTMKTIHRMLRRPGCPNPLQVPLGQELAIYMLNNKRELLMAMGAQMDTRVEIIVDTKLP